MIVYEVERIHRRVYKLVWFQMGLYNDIKQAYGVINSHRDAGMT